MPGVIQPQRSQGSMGSALQLGQAVMQAKGAFGGGGQQPPDPGAQPSAGNIGDSTQAAQGQAVPQQQPAPIGDYPTGGNVFQRRITRSY